MYNLLDINSLNELQISSILSKAKSCKTIPEINNNFKNKNKIIISLFFENSTRTKLSFDISARKLNAEIIHFDIDNSSLNKGESLIDTINTLISMKPNILIIRHKSNEIPKEISQKIKIPIINAGDGTNQHPTQALSDLYTIQENLGFDLKGKTISIVGDIKTSRVANSNIDLLTKIGMNVILVGPEEFLPNRNDLEKTTDIKLAIKKSDVVMRLRTQFERSDDFDESFIIEYSKKYCITKELLEDKDIIVLHPGPVHRNIDISDEILDDDRCKMLNQVENSIYIRMAIIDLMLNP